MKINLESFRKNPALNLLVITMWFMMIAGMIMIFLPGCDMLKTPSRNQFTSTNIKGVTVESYQFEQNTLYIFHDLVRDVTCYHLTGHEFQCMALDNKIIGAAIPSVKDTIVTNEEDKELYQAIKEDSEDKNRFSGRNNRQAYNELDQAIQSGRDPSPRNGSTTTEGF